MPEIDTLHGIEYQVKRVVSSWMKQHPAPFTVRPIIFPRTFAVGTKSRRYTTCTVDRRRPFLRPENLEKTARDHVHVVDQRRVQGTPLEHLLGLLEGGELLVKARGKEAVFVAGQFAFRVNLGLEGIAVIISTNDFWELVAHDCPGHSPDGEKSELMRSFVVPLQLTTPKARLLKRDQDLTVFLAFVGERDTILITDHSRLLRVHVMVLPYVLKDTDLEPDSKIWAKLWSGNHGPDWIYERPSAERALKRWVDAKFGCSSDSSRQCLDNYFIQAGNSADALASLKAVATPPEPTIARWSQTVLSFLTMSQDVFNGYGEHTANDLCHAIGVWPGMPMQELCMNTALFRRFKCALHTYAAQYVTDDYRTLCLSTPNAGGAFAFNYKSDNNYINRYVKVYRKCSVRLERDEYNAYAMEGLFNCQRTIGEPYPWSEQDLIHVKHKDVAVYMFKNARDEPFYTVIRARPPGHWYLVQGPFLVEKNLLNAGMSTTIGPASFFLYKQNQHDPKKRGTPGRKRIFRTGKPGRPSLEPKIADLRIRAKRRTLFVEKIKAELTGVKVTRRKVASRAVLPPPSDRITRSRARAQALAVVV